jgi:hypothetical protein
LQSNPFFGSAAERFWLVESLQSNPLGAEVEPTLALIAPQNRSDRNDRRGVSGSSEESGATEEPRHDDINRQGDILLIFDNSGD